MTNSDKKKHIYILDDLRGIAILFVVIYHYFFVYYKNIDTNNMFINNIKFINDYFNFGVFGVSLFFLVSGFVIPMSLKGDNKKQTVYNFAIRRFFRLYPTYWFAIIFISVVVLVFKDSNAYSIQQILINFTMLQDIFKTKSIDGVFWTLMVELKFYFLTALFFYFAVLKHIKYIIIVFFLLSSITLYLSYIDGTRSFGNSLFSYLMIMYLGTAFYFYNNNIITKKNLLFLIILICIYFSYNHIFLINNAFGDKLGNSIATICAIFIFIFAINYKKSFSQITTFFGNISYSFYLIHQIIGYLIISQLIELKIPFAQIIVFLFITLISYFMNKYVEKTTNQYGYKYVK